jgi:hypothetical protein
MCLIFGGYNDSVSAEEAMSVGMNFEGDGHVLFEGAIPVFSTREALVTGQDRMKYIQNI